MSDRTSKTVTDSPDFPRRAAELLVYIENGMTYELGALSLATIKMALQKCATVETTDVLPKQWWIDRLKQQEAITATLAALLREWLKGCPNPPDWHWSFDVHVRTVNALGDSPLNRPYSPLEPAAREGLCREGYSSGAR